MCLNYNRETRVQHLMAMKFLGFVYRVLTIRAVGSTMPRLVLRITMPKN